MQTSKLQNRVSPSVAVVSIHSIMLDYKRMFRHDIKFS